MASSPGSPPLAPPRDPYTNDTIQAFLTYMTDNSCQGITFDARYSYRKRRFFPQRVLNNYFNCAQKEGADRVKDLVTAATKRSDERTDYRVVASDCPKVFTILAFIGQSHHINHFVQRTRLQDSGLPFRVGDKHLFPVIGNNRTFFDDFYRIQWEFCVTPLNARLTLVDLEDDLILPLLSLERVDKTKGSSASVHRFEVHEDYDRLGGRQAPHSIPHVYAIKSYYPSAADSDDALNPRSPHDLPRPKDYYDAEVDAFRRLNESGEPVPNLVRFYAAFTQNKSRHIILQYANVGTLEDYWRKVDPPRQGDDILSLWSRLFEVNRALVQIHETDSKGDPGLPQIFQGWHEDIKPSNILVAGDIENTPYEVQFLLADLGLSHFSATTEGSENTTREGRGGSQAYSAPERNLAVGPGVRFNPKVKQNIDTWSLACVYCEFHAWTIGGFRGHYGVYQYRQARMNDRDVDKSLGACFHDKDGGLLPTVEKWHQDSLTLCATRDHVTPIIWRDLLWRMLDPPEYRLQSRQVIRYCQEVIKTARRRLTESTSREEHTMADEHHSNSPPRTPPQLPPGYNDPRAQQGTGTYPWTPPEDDRAGSLQNDDINYANGSSGGSNGLRDGRSPPENWRSPMSSPDDPQFSHVAKHNRVLSSGTNESNYEMPLDETRRSPPLHSPMSKSGSIAVRSKPTGLIESKLPRRSTVPPRMTLDPQEHTRFNGKSRPIGIAESWALPDSSKIGYQEREMDERQPRQLSTSQPERFLSVEELQHWDEETRKAKKPKLSFSRAREVRLPFQDELLGELKKRDHVFVIDDGGSMYRYWDELLNLYTPMIYLVKKQKLDPNGSELRFITSEKRKEAQDTTPLVNMVKERKDHLSGHSNLAHRLEDIIEAYRRKLESNPRTTKPISLYIFTDGKWQPGDRHLEAVGRAIKSLVEFLDKLGLRGKMAGIQFIQFGNDPVGTERLRWLDEDLQQAYGLSRDICDTTPSNGNVWKMLLGSINDYMDNDHKPSETPGAP